MEPSSDAYLHRYFIRGVMGAPPHSVRIKIEHLSFQVRLNEHINNLESPSNVRGEAFVARRQTWVRSLMKETMAPTSELSHTSPSKSPRLSVVEVFTIDPTPLSKRTPSDGARKPEALRSSGG